MTITVSGSSIKNFIFFVKLFLEIFWKIFYDIFVKMKSNSYICIIVEKQTKFNQQTSIGNYGKC